MIAITVMARPVALRSPACAKSADLWVGGNVDLGDGGRGQEGIAGMVQGSIGIVNLEGAAARARSCGRVPEVYRTRAKSFQNTWQSSNC
jgi:hypothetical protein